MKNQRRKKKTDANRRTKGRDRAKKIIRAAQKILIEEGYHALTLRRISNELSISNGNLTYYFPTKEFLIKAVVTDKLTGYDAVYQEQLKKFPDDPKQRLISFFLFLLADSKDSESQQFFYQIWAMSAHNQDIAKLREQIYQLYLDRVTDFFARAMPNKSPEEIKHKAFLLMSLNEGLSVMFGNGSAFCKSFSNLDDYLAKQIKIIIDI